MILPDAEHILSLDYLRADDQQKVAVGYLAEMTDQEWLRQKAEGKGQNYLEHIKKQLSNKAALPRVLTRPGLPKQQRRQPSFREAALETAKRLEAISKITEGLPDTVHAVVCGGSMAYGRFFSIRGNPDPSDIDLLYVVEQDFFTNGDIENIFSANRGFSNVEGLSERAKKFDGLYTRIEADMMSHKLRYDDFLVSAKMFPFSAFKKEYIDDPLQAFEEGHDVHAVVRDYKERPYSTPFFTQYNFLHEPLPVTITQEVMADGSAITSIPSFIIQDGHFYTGDHHNHVIPAASIEALLDPSVVDILVQFGALLSTRAKHEQMRYNRSDINVLNVQDRKGVFSPQKRDDAVWKTKGYIV